MLNGEPYGRTIVLLIASALCVRSSRLTQLDLGFDPRNVLTFSLRFEGYRQDARKSMTCSTGCSSASKATRAVVAAGAVNTLPSSQVPSDGTRACCWRASGRRYLSPGPRNPNLNFLAVTPQYFRSMSIRLIQGRRFTDQDHVNAPYVVIVSQALGDRLWPGQNPVGKRLRTGFLVKRDDNVKADWQTVVGVVATARYREIQTPRLDLYVPFRQADPIAESFVIRTTVPPEPLVRNAEKRPTQFRSTRSPCPLCPSNWTHLTGVRLLPRISRSTQGYETSPRHTGRARPVGGHAGHADPANAPGRSGTRPADRARHRTPIG